MKKIILALAPALLSMPAIVDAAKPKGPPIIVKCGANGCWEVPQRPL